jgi:hypothetical protein
MMSDRTNKWKAQVIKRVLGFTKVCYRGLTKNRHRLVVAVRWRTCSWCASACSAFRRRSLSADRTHGSRPRMRRHVAELLLPALSEAPAAGVIIIVMTCSDVP